MAENELVMRRLVIVPERPPFPHNMLTEPTNCCNYSCV